VRQAPVRPCPASEIKIHRQQSQAISKRDIDAPGCIPQTASARVKSGQKKAGQLTEEALKMTEATRIRALVSDDQVDASFERFASSNKLSSKAAHSGPQSGRR